MVKKRRYAYELIEGRREVRELDPLEEEIRKEEEELAREARRLRLEEIVAKRRKRIRELEGESGKGGEPSDLGISVTMARELANLPEEERTKVIQTYALLRSAEKGLGSNAALILPFLIGYAKTNPGATPKDYVEYGKTIVDSFTKGMEMGKSIQPPQTVNLVDIIDKLKELATRETPEEKLEKMVEKLAEKLRPQPSALEQILLNDTLYERARELGLFGGKGGASKSEIDLEIEKLRTERELQIKKLELEMQKAILEHQANERRTEQLLSTIFPFGAFLAKPISDRMRELGRNVAGHIAQSPASKGGMIRVICPCGYRGFIEFEGSRPPEKVNCPSCGRELVVGEAPRHGGEAEGGSKEA